MILEVHNTFGDRRLYLLEANDPVTKAAGDSEINSKDDEAKQTAKRSNGLMRRAWPKDFHVSPFNSRKGEYSLVAIDPFAPMLEGRGTLDNTISLVSSKSPTELVARIFSNGDAIDPDGLSFWHKLKFLASWWWVGFVTFPRIVKPGGILFFKRQLHVWYRPEPLKESLGRRAKETERQLELSDIPSGITDATVEPMISPSTQEAVDAKDALEFKVLTPAFYTQLHDLDL
ncbi:hypothetical protein AB5N19_09071 [Seiridium cardinale]|uniref:Uncharacterized protein n=1 Tax=Seiridium cardinale TaxID=138064 RepID=A0ABR2Y6Z8_9PEZI